MSQPGSSDEISDRLRAELEYYRGQWVLILNGMVVGHSFDLSAIIEARSQWEASGLQKCLLLSVPRTGPVA